MKMFAMTAAAAMMTMTGLVPASLSTAASAQHRDHRRVVKYHREHVRTRRVCTVRHHHRVCRTVRY